MLVVTNMKGPLCNSSAFRSESIGIGCHKRRGCGTSLVLRAAAARRAIPTQQSPSHAWTPPAPTIKVGSLNSLSGTMAISEVTVRDAIKLAVERDQCRGRRDGQADPDRRRGRRLRAHRLRREGREADQGATASPRCSAGGRRRAARRCCRSSRATTRCCTTPCSTRAWSRRRTSSTPAPPPTSRSCPASTTSRRRASNRCTWWAATTCSRRPPTASSRPTRRPTASRSRARTTPRWARRTSPPSSTRSAPPTPTRCSTPSTATPTWRSSASTRTSA